MEKSAAIGLLMTSSPESENRRTVMKISEAALRQGHRVRIFLMYDGVYHILRDDFMELADKGVEIILCAYDADVRQVPRREGVLFGSQYDLSEMVAKGDAFLSFH